MSAANLDQYDGWVSLWIGTFNIGPKVHKFTQGPMLYLSTQQLVLQLW